MTTQHQNTPAAAPAGAAVEVQSECDNCGFICPITALNEAKDLDKRLDYPVGHPKCVIPAGECPQCGALSYPVTSK